MRGLAVLTLLGLTLATAPLAGADAVGSADDVPDAVRDALAPVQCDALDCGPGGAVHAALRLTASGADPNAWPIASCASLDCGPGGWVAPLLP